MPKILVVDSESGMRQIIEKILSPQGYEIVSVEDGNQAIAAFPKVNPDLVLLDVRLPDFDSADIFAKLQSMKEGLPIVILSGIGEVETAADLVAKGAFSYIHKPFKVDSLRHMVKRALNNQVALAIDAPPQEAPEETESSTNVKGQKKTRVMRALLFVGAPAILVAGAALFLVLRGVPEAEFPLSYGNATGISFDGKHIWIADWADETIYEHARNKTFQVVASYKTPGIEPTGIAFDSSFIWISHSFGSKIYQRKRDATLTEVGSFPSPGASTSGLFFDGDNLWSLDYQRGKIYKHNRDATLSVAAIFESPAVNPCGMFKFGKEFYIADASTNRVYKVDVTDFSLRGIYQLPSIDNNKNHLSGIAWDGRSIWVCMEGIQKVLRIPLNKLQSVKHF